MEGDCTNDMLKVVFFLISFCSSTIGAISGIGGGVIIKPVLDATGIMQVSTISWLSGCTVLSMAIISLIRSKGSGVKLDVKKSTWLALGAALGGIIGKEIFDKIKYLFHDENMIGAIQASLLLLITLGVFLYIKLKNRIKTHQIQNIAACFIIGLLLGLISAFLGIGGGPINIAVLYYFFSMDSKTAAKNSIYIILFSQVTSFFSTILKGTIPNFDMAVLVLMIIGGVVGGVTGSTISKKLTAEKVELVFTVLLFVIIGVNIYNMIRFISVI